MPIFICIIMSSRLQSFMSAARHRRRSRGSFVILERDLRACRKPSQCNGRNRACIAISLIDYIASKIANGKQIYFKRYQERILFHLYLKLCQLIQCKSCGSIMGFIYKTHFCARMLSSAFIQTLTILSGRARHLRLWSPSGIFLLGG